MRNLLYAMLIWQRQLRKWTYNTLAATKPSLCSKYHRDISYYDMACQIQTKFHIMPSDMWDKHYLNGSQVELWHANSIQKNSHLRTFILKTHPVFTCNSQYASSNIGYQTARSSTREEFATKNTSNHCLNNSAWALHVLQNHTIEINTYFTYVFSFEPPGYSTCRSECLASRVRAVL